MPRDDRVLVQPASTVIHCEGVTAGIDPEQGVKRHQVKNKAQFAGKWARHCSSKPSRERVRPRPSRAPKRAGRTCW
ncbi:hypothetical protein B1A_07002 [mine drainage metagenome]|uniref:Uncharacterized protein n=1 Tax=mine drainage metagenome TaxID=410659 RepID=T1BHQ3_9ZZZZ